MSNFPTTDKFEIYLEKIRKDQRAYDFLNNIWESKELYVGGVVNYDSAISNGIKVFSQSIFSHTNFFNPSNFTTYGSENMLGVISRDYSKDNDGRFYYVTRKLNLDYLSCIMSLSYIEDIFQKVGKMDSADIGKMQRYFTSFVKYRESEKAPKFEEVISVDLGMIEADKIETDKISRFLEDKKGLKYGKPIKMKGAEFSRYFSYLKEFLILGVIKDMLLNYSKKYDLGGAILTAATPWEMIDIGSNEVFCSEFVAEALFYSGFYPFDIGVKDPKSVTPGDIMDISIIFERDSEKLYLVDDSAGKDGHIKDISLGLDAKSEFLKNHIIDKEKDEPYFIRQKGIVEKIDSFIKFLTGLAGDR